jgi:hypothetical protein
MTMGEGGSEERADVDAPELVAVTLETSEDSARLESVRSPVASEDPGSACPAALSLRALNFLH